MLHGKLSKLHMAIIGTGIGFTIGSIILGFGGFDVVVDMVVAKMIRLTPGGMTWELWRTVPLPIYFKLRFYNICNADQLSSGAKAIVQEMGPYTYLVDYEKVDIEVNNDTTEVKYKQNVIYTFQPDLSNGTVLDRITIINPMFLTVAKIANDFTDIEFILETLDELLTDKGEKLTRTVRLKSIAFDGVSVKPYIDLINDPVVQQVGGDDFSVPDSIADGLFALFKGRNNTDGGEFVVKTGFTGSNDVGKIVSIDNETVQHIWKGETCNMLNGTDGTIFAPFLTPDKDVSVFVRDVCRPLTFVYANESEFDGITTGLYNLKDFHAPANYPENACFCHLKSPNLCSIDGLTSLEPCTGAPIYLSKANFLSVDQSLSMADGIKTDPALHESFAHFHMLTGSPLFVSIKIQFSLDLTPYMGMPSFENVTRAWVPLVSIETTAELDDGNKLLLKVADVLIGAWPLMRFGLILVGLCIIGGGGLMVYLKHRSNIQKEKEALEVIAEYKQ